MEPVTARWQWTSEDLAEGRRFHAKTLGLVRVALIWAFPSAVLTFLVLRSGKEIDFGHLLSLRNAPEVLLVIGVIILCGVGTACLVVLVMRTIISPALRRREFSKRTDAYTELRWTFGEDKIIAESEHSHSEMGWPVFHKIIHGPKGFLFMPSAQIFHFIPRRAFISPADVEKVRELARARAVAYSEIR